MAVVSLFIIPQREWAASSAIFTVLKVSFSAIVAIEVFTITLTGYYQLGQMNPGFIYI
jgi:hypothetical protein